MFPGQRFGTWSLSHGAFHPFCVCPRSGPGHQTVMPLLASLHPVILLLDGPSRASFWKKWVRGSRGTGPISSIVPAPGKLFPALLLAGVLLLGSTWQERSPDLPWLWASLKSPGTRPHAKPAALAFVPTIGTPLSLFSFLTYEWDRCTDWDSAYIFKKYLCMHFSYIHWSNAHTFHNLTTKHNLTLKSGCVI